MPYYDGQNGGTTRRARGGGRQSDLLMQQLGTSSSVDSDDADGAGDFSSLGFDGNSTTSSAPLTFDESTDTRIGNPRKRRGNGSRLGNASGQARAERPHAAGMIRNDEEVARRQQIIQGVASDQMSMPRNVGSDLDEVRMSAPSIAQPRPEAPATSRPRQQMGPVMGIRLNDEPKTEATNDGESRNPANVLADRLRQLRGKRIVNPITFVRENGGGVETLGIWLYEYRQLFIALTIVLLIIGVLFDRRISFGGGIAMILIGIWIGRIDDENDIFNICLCGFLTAMIPFVLTS